MDEMWKSKVQSESLRKINTLQHTNKTEFHLCCSALEDRLPNMHKKGSDCLCLQCQEKLRERVFQPGSQEQELTE